MGSQARDVEVATPGKEEEDDDNASTIAVSLPDETSTSGSSSESWLYRRRLFLNFEVLKPKQHKAGISILISKCEKYWTQRSTQFLVDKLVTLTVIGLGSALGNGLILFVKMSSMVEAAVLSSWFNFVGRSDCIYSGTGPHSGIPGCGLCPEGKEVQGEYGSIHFKQRWMWKHTSSARS